MPFNVCPSELIYVFAVELVRMCGILFACVFSNLPLLFEIKTKKCFMVQYIYVLSELYRKGNAT